VAKEGWPSISKRKINDKPPKETSSGEIIKQNLFKLFTQSASFVRKIYSTKCEKLMINQ
jgi:hypothetical protein